MRETRRFALYLDGIIFSLAELIPPPFVPRIIRARLYIAGIAAGKMISREDISAYLSRKFSVTRILETAHRSNAIIIARRFARHVS